LATYLEISKEYIMVKDVFYNINDNLISEIETIYNDCKWFAFEKLKKGAVGLATAP